MNFLFLLLTLITSLFAVNLEKSPQSFVLKTKQIIIPEFPAAFNPSIIRWNGKILLSFRNISNPKDSYNSSEIGLIWLDENFEPCSTPQILELCDNHSNLCKRAEDARLIEIDGHLFMIYSNNENAIISKGGFRVYVAEIYEKDDLFFLISKDRLSQYEGENPNLREKNWTPFNYNGNLLLSYSLNPHLVFKPIQGTEIAETVAYSEKSLPKWKWGELRGGTQTLEMDGRYLTFFHTAIKRASDHSDGKDMLHYYMGASTFNKEPPFEMIEISPEPIIGRGFFSGTVYKQYWGSWRGIFPGGFIYDDKNIHIVYGRQNRELWVATLDKKGLLDSLIPVENNQ